VTTSNRFRVEPLDSRHDRAAFTCGVEALDRYFHQQAGHDARRMIAVVFVLFDTAETAIAGYYTLSATSTEATQLPDDVTRKLPRNPLLPAILLGRLAIHVRYQGQRLGKVLLIDALQRSRVVAGQIGATFVVVDSKDDAARDFYERFGFRQFRDDAYRLFIPMSTIDRGAATLS
jgi:GNAT superfamily N-acetyltransferase